MRTAWVVLRKDLRVESRTLETLPAMILLALVTFVIFHFGLNRDTISGQEAAGVLTLDQGAVRAVLGQRRSLLPAGITALDGRFHGGDVVDLNGPDAVLVARGVVAYDAAELATMIGRSTSDLPAELRRPAVHADDLVAV